MELQSSASGWLIKKKEDGLIYSTPPAVYVINILLVKAIL
jgi:hypothetical protein